MKPVPGKFDEGKPMYDSDMYSNLLPHTLTLPRLHRQNEELDHMFVAALEDIRHGVCSPETAVFIVNSLNRPKSGPYPLHLYLTNIEADVHNAEQLHMMDGPREVFEASDWGKVEHIQCPAGKRVYFKAGAPVMVVYNITFRKKSTTGPEEHSLQNVATTPLSRSMVLHSN